MTQLPAFPSTSDLIAWWARLAPARVAIVDRTRGGRHTYADVNASAERWVRALASLGVTFVNWVMQLFLGKWAP